MPNFAEVKILEEAKKLVKKGWIKGRSADGNGNYCATGACVAASQQTNAGQAYKSIVMLDQTAKRMGFGSAAGLNDAPSTSKEKVLDLFDQAIADAIAAR